MENYKVAVLLQPDKTKSGTPMFCVPQKIINMLECYNIDVELIYLTPIFDYSYKEYFDGVGPIIPNNSYEKMKNKVLSCDGLLLTGGNEFYLPEIKLIQDAYKNKLPIFGICLGMQTILAAFGGKCIPLDEKIRPLHSGTIHKININKNSQLSSLGTSIEVNSYHSFHVVFDEEKAALTDCVSDLAAFFVFYSPTIYRWIYGLSLDLWVIVGLSFGMFSLPSQHTLQDSF